MEAILIKTEFGFKLNDLDGVYIASVATGSLSLKNCQAIERGYDLDELAEKNTSDCDASGCYPEDVFKKGFQKALEILGDKKFSESDVMLGWDAGIMSKSILVDISGEYGQKKLKEHRDSYQKALKPVSLKQTEWDVEVETEPYVKYVSRTGNTIYPPLGIQNKLDADGCLILKRI